MLKSKLRPKHVVVHVQPVSSTSSKNLLAPARPVAVRARPVAASAGPAVAPAGQGH